MDKNRKKWEEIANIEVFQPILLKDGICMSPTTPESYDGKRFEDFWGDSIYTDNKPLTRRLIHIKYPW